MKDSMSFCFSYLSGCQDKFFRRFSVFYKNNMSYHRLDKYEKFPVRIRNLAVRRILAGEDADSVANDIGCHKYTIRKWVAAYEEVQQDSN